MQFRHCKYGKNIIVMRKQFLQSNYGGISRPLKVEIISRFIYSLCFKTILIGLTTNIFKHHFGIELSK